MSEFLKLVIGKLPNKSGEKVLKVVSEAGIDTDEARVICGKSVNEPAVEVVDNNSVVHYVATGGMGIDKEVLLISGVDLTYANEIKSAIYQHDYSGRFLQIGKARWIKKDAKGIRVMTVFAKHQLAQDLRALYCDDVDGTGPIAICWSIDYIPLQIERPGTKGWGKALAQAIEERPDLATNKGEIKSIVTKSVMVGYSATPMGINPESISLWEGKGVDESMIEAARRLADAGTDTEAEQVSDDISEASEQDRQGADGSEQDITPNSDDNVGAPAPEAASDGDEPEASMKDAEPDADIAEDIVETETVEPSEPKEMNNEVAEHENEAEDDAGDNEPEVSLGDAPGDGESAEEGGEAKESEKAEPEDSGDDAPADEEKAEPATILITADDPLSLEVIGDNSHGAFTAQANEVDNPAEVLAARQAQIKETMVKGKGFQEYVDYLSFSLPIYGEIEDNQAMRIVDWLLGTSVYDPEAEITLYINSPGGYCTSGFAIIDAMEFIPNKVRTIAFGEVCSMGLLIFMAGDERVIAPNAAVLSHRFWAITAGTQAELEAASVEHKNVHERIINHYIKYSKYDNKADIEENLLKTVDVWLTPKQAIAFKLADRLLDERTIVTEAAEPEEGDVEGKAIKGIPAGQKTESEASIIMDQLITISDQLSTLKDRVDDERRSRILSDEERDTVSVAIDNLSATLNILEALYEGQPVKDADKPEIEKEAAVFAEQISITAEQIAEAVKAGLSEGTKPLIETLGKIERGLGIVR